MTSPATTSADVHYLARRPKPLPDIAQLPPDALLTRNQLAPLTGYSVEAFKKWARIGRGPKVTRVEGRPRYRARDVMSWLGIEAAA